MINIILLFNIFIILIILLFNIKKQNKQIVIFLCVLIFFILFTIIFNFLVNKNKNNKLAKNNYLYHITTINNNYEDINEIYDLAIVRFDNEVHKLLAHNNNKLDAKFIDLLYNIKNNVINDIINEFNNKLSQNIIKQLHIIIDNKIELYKTLMMLNMNINNNDNNIIYNINENQFLNLVLNAFYDHLNKELNIIKFIDDSFIDNLVNSKKDIINNIGQSYVLSNFELYYKDNNYSKDFLNHYYELLKKIDFKLDKEIEKLKHIWNLNHDINKKIIPKNMTSVKHSDLLDNSGNNIYRNDKLIPSYNSKDCTDDGSCLIY